MATTEQSGTHEENVAKLRDLIKGIGMAMLTTAMPDGTLHSRPMAAQQSEFDGDLWFFTGASSHKVDELQANNHVNVSFAKPEDQHYVSVSGTAEIVRDRAKMEELWNPAYKAWFPEGLDDPNIALLKVSVTMAEYWDSPSSAVAHIIGLAKAYVTGESAKDVGDHAKLDL